MTPSAPTTSATPFMAVQNRWLRQMRDRAVSIQLHGGAVISGVLLVGDDSDTLALRIPGHAEAALVYKHSIAVVVPATPAARGADDAQPARRAATVGPATGTATVLGQERQRSKPLG